MSPSSSRSGSGDVAVDAALEVERVTFAYAPGRPVLRAVDLVARAGEVTMILGRSGSGKTTLLKLCKGLLRARGGQIRVLGEPVIVGVGRGKLDPRVAYIPQQLGLTRTLTVLENVLTGALARVSTGSSLLGWPDHELARAGELIGRLGLGAKANDKVYALSGGERQRVAIGRALMQSPRILLADEFISELDPVTTGTIMAVARESAAAGVAVVMTTHEMEIVREHADHVVVLREGEKILDEQAAPSIERVMEAFR